MIPIVFGVLALTFILSRMMPGDPVLALLVSSGIPHPNPDVYDAMVRQLGLDQPLIVQFFRFVGELFTGQWGVSISVSRDKPVWDLIMDRLPLTIDLSVISIVLAAFLGIKAGIISAKHRNKAKDTIVRTIALLGVTIPIFFLGMLLQYFLGYRLDLFPATGYKNMAYTDPETVTGFYMIDALIAGQWYKIGDYLVHMVLPVFCLTFITLASITRQTRSSMLEVLQQDYIRTARAKGCREKDVINTHALKNALIPTVTVIGFNVAGLLDGAVLTESTFGLVGMGKLLIDAIDLNDYWVINAVVFFITILYTSVNLITDMAYALLDPRIRY